MSRMVTAILTILLLATIAQADWTPPVNPELILPSLNVLNESNEKQTLTSALNQAGIGPVLLVPIYTRCRGTCSQVVSSLKKGLRGLSGGASPRVALFSFDDADSAEDMRTFRARESIPASWLFFRAESGLAARNFLDAFSFPLMRNGSQYGHPSETFILTSELRWSGSLADSALTAESIEEGLRRARSSRFGAALYQPKTLLFAGVMGLLFSLFFLFAALRRIQETEARNARSATSSTGN